MDPEANLKEMLELVERIEELTCDSTRDLDIDGIYDAADDISRAASRLAILVESLNDWLSSGGFLPKAWAPKPKPAAKPVFPKVPENTSVNFDTLVRAMSENAILLMSCWDSKEERPVTVICAGAWGKKVDEGVEASLTPFALMLNEYEIAYDRFVAPTTESELLAATVREGAVDGRPKGRSRKGPVGSGPAAVAKRVRKGPDARVSKVRTK